MANPEHLEILKKGVDVWNEWRRKNPETRPNLQRVSLSNMRLCGVNFNDVNLSEAIAEGTDLTKAYLVGANLQHSIFYVTSGHSITLNCSLLRGVNLKNADLRDSQIECVDFTGASLDEVDFSNAKIGLCWFVDNDFRKVKGLETVEHRGPSEIGISTIYRSEGKIPESFLRGCGVPNGFITYMRSLTAQPIQFYSCFISYSSKDQEFAERLHSDLQAKGVRVWFAPHDMKIGAHIRPTIDESIRVYDKLLPVLSKHSVSSQWVEQEVETALAKERESEGKTILFPIRIDDAVMEIKSGWPALLKNTRNVGDFTNWKDHDSYQKAFDRLLRALKAET
jgi:hypothetical protein